MLTVFDDGYDGVLPQDEKESRALILHVDYDEMLVTLRKQFTHPGERVLAKAMGNAQLLPDGGMFVGWGTNPYFSEFDADGKLILDGELIKGDPTYRSFIGDWSGHPAERPAAAARHRSGGATVYASWNGATEVASWTVFAGRAQPAMTQAPLGAQVRFRDRHRGAEQGALLLRAGARCARSPAVQVSSSQDRLSPACPRPFTPGVPELLSYARVP